MNAEFPMEVTLLGIVTAVSEVQSLKAISPREVTLFGMLIDASEVQPLNAQFPMEMTLLGIVTEVSVAHPENALDPMPIVGYPPKVGGIEIAPPAPVYPIIVAIPPLTVY